MTVQNVLMVRLEGVSLTERVNERNALRARALKEGFEGLVVVERNIAVPENILDLLACHGKDVVIASCFQQAVAEEPLSGSVVLVKRTRVPMAWAFVEEPKTVRLNLLSFNDVWPSRLMEVSMAALKCAFFSRRALEKIEFHANPDNNVDEYFFFALDCQRNGITQYLDSGACCALP